MKRMNKNTDPKKRILLVALSEFNKKGFDKTTMTAISKKTGLSRTLINFYFKNKKSLHIELEELALEILYKELVTSINSSLTPKEQLKDVVKCLINFYLTNNGLYECLMRSEEKTGIQLKLKTKSNLIVTLIMNIIQKGIDNNDFKNPYNSLESAAISTWCIAHGYASIIHHKARVIKTYWKIDRPMLYQEAIQTIDKVFTN